MGEEAKSEPLNWTRFYRFLIFCGCCLLVLLTVGAVYYPIVMPILVAAFFTYLLASTVDRIEAFGVSRWLAVLGIILISVSLVVLLITRIVPMLYEQILFLGQLAPKATRLVIDNWLPLLRDFLVEYQLMQKGEFDQYIQDLDIIDEVRAQVQSGLEGLWYTGTTLLGGAFNTLLIPVLLFFMLNELPKIAVGLRRMIPLDLMAPTTLTLRRISGTLRSVIKGQAMVAGILAVLYVIGLSIVGLPSAIAIGVVAGMCRIIPYVDVIVGGILSGIVLLSSGSSWGQVLGVVIVFLVVQTIDAMFITPRVIGERVGLHPGVVIASVVAFGTWFGFWGVLMAIPVIAIAKTIALTGMPYYLQSRFYAPAWYGARRSTETDTPT